MVGEEKRKVTNNHLLVTFIFYVDYYDKLSNFMRALLALESFSNSIRMDEMKDSLI